MSQAGVWPVRGAVCRNPFGGALLAAALALVLAACEERRPEPEPEPETAEEPETPEVRLSRADFDSLPGWRGDSLDEALPALLRSCERLLRQPGERPVGPKGLGGTVKDWEEPCRDLESLPDDVSTDMVRGRMESHFVPFSVAGPDGEEGLFTGYYEATLNGARFPGEDYNHPLYEKPGDLIEVRLGEFRADLEGERVFGRVNGTRLHPYHTRSDIAEGALDGRNLELIWADDPVDVFFLHVQGSGIVRLPDGETQRVGFAGSNGHRFTAIGRELIRRGAMEGRDMSMQGIRDWLRENPEEADELMRMNARYIFFREIEGEGPIGAQGVALTPRRSLAIDPTRLPLGAPMWLDTTFPGSDGKPLQRLMVAQDTGSAIRGTVRGDFFWGPGEAALEFAGRMKQTGRYWLLLPRAAAERQAPAS